MKQCVFIAQNAFLTTAVRRAPLTEVTAPDNHRSTRPRRMDPNQL